MADFASIQSVRREAVRIGLKPPPRLRLSQWADENFRLSAESSAQAGRWTSLPYQRSILDAVTDPRVTHVSVMKSARVGYTLMVSAAVGYFIHQEPCSILIVQPTVDDAKGYSKETIAPMLRDVPVLSKIIFEDVADVGPKDSGNTIMHKKFPGGVLSLAGANSGAGLRRVSRRVVIFDEVDAYPPSAGSDGDPVTLGSKRAEYFWNRKILAGSTPLVAGASRIEQMFLAGDQRRFYVPCPQCGYMDTLVFNQKSEHGHWMSWPKGDPKAAHFVCRENGCIIEHKDKRQMVAAGEWRAAKPFAGHASFHVWAAYSYSPNATWGQLAEEFLAAKGNSETLRVFVNTVLGETWKEPGDAPEWRRLHQRREPYPIGSIPAGVIFLTAGVDVQKDRWVYEVVGWGEGKESWSIDSGVIMGDTGNDAEWTKLDELLNRSYRNAEGLNQSILCLAVDSGFQTNTVYSWARMHPRDRVMAVKGVATAKTPLGTPSPVDVTFAGKRLARGYKVWPLCVDMLKSELYGWLKLPSPSLENGEEYPGGFCHFPEYGEDFFRQITAEQLVSVVTKQGFTKYEWQQLPHRENHQLDARVYARAAAAHVGLDRLPPKVSKPAVVPGVLVATPVKPDVPAPAPAPRQASGFLSKGARSDFRFHGTGWLSKKR